MSVFNFNWSEVVEGSVGGRKVIQARNVFREDERLMLLDDIISVKETFRPIYSGTGRNYWPNLHLSEHARVGEALLHDFSVSSIDLLFKIGVVDEFALGRCAATYSSIGDAGSFARHTDTVRSPKRRLTVIVYPGSVEPGFSGGDLLFYERGEDVPSWAIAPESNSLVAFDPSIEHEVAEVRTQSSRWTQRRLAMNGWLFEAD